jgi:hypothetical protein
MKRMILLVALAIGMNPFLFAGDKHKESEMTGTICDQRCVKQDADKAACDLSCTEQTGQTVFIDDQGKTWKVANPAVCEGHMGKKVKVKCKQKKEDTLEILGIYG